METTKSPAYKFVEFMWQNMGTNSHSWTNEVMYNTVKLAIEGNLEFYEDDFKEIAKNMRGGYWFHVNSNGKGMGEWFYSTAVKYSNNSAIHSFEKYANLKPYITKEGHRLHSGSRLMDSEFRYTVTGFDYDSGRIYLVAYALSDHDEKGKRKLFNFNNKEWLEFRKTIKER
jgi:hypothetical protein